MIDRTHDLPIVRQAKVLNISRGCVYYKPTSDVRGGSHPHASHR